MNKKKKSHKRNQQTQHQPKLEMHDSVDVASQHGIKVETPLLVGGQAGGQSRNSNGGGNSNKPSQSSVQLSLTMGASEILLRMSQQQQHMHNLDETTGAMKEEGGVKEEWGVEREMLGVAPMQAPVNEDSEEEQEMRRHEEIDDEYDDDDECQLKVVFQDDGEDASVVAVAVAPICAVAETAPAALAIGESVSQLESERARQWREQLETGTFKIRKSSQRLPAAGDSMGVAATAVVTPMSSPAVLARDMWQMRQRDAAASAFGALAVLGSMAEAGSKIERSSSVSRPTGEKPTAAEVKTAIEEGAVGRLRCWGQAWPALLGDGTLVLAARAGFCDVGRLVLAAGADVNQRDEDGGTPLMVAAEHGHELMCQLLIVHGGQINSVNKKGESAIIKAVSRGHKECVLVLLQHGCDLMSIDSESGPLCASRKMNMHEMECVIAEHHASYSEKLTKTFLLMMHNTVTIAYTIFPLRVVSLFESSEFEFEFSAKIPPVRNDECNLLVIFFTMVSGRQLRFCLRQQLPVELVCLNDLEQQPHFESGSRCVTGLTPIIDGANCLKLRTSGLDSCRWARLMVIGFRVKLNTNTAAKNT